MKNFLSILLINASAILVSACGSESNSNNKNYPTSSHNSNSSSNFIVVPRDAQGDVLVPMSEFTEIPLIEDWFFEVDGQGKNYNFYLYKPQSYKNTTTQVFPLLIVLHGDNGYKETRPKLTPYPLRSGVFDAFVGVNGTNLLATGRDSLNAHVREAFVIHPEVPHIDRSGLYTEPLGYWNPNALNNLVNYMTEHYRVDMNRIYVIGASMGGFGTFHYAQSVPEKIAAIIPICGGLFEYQNRAHRLKDMPIWLFHNYDDQTVRFTTSILPVVNTFMQTDVWNTFPGSIPPINEYTISYDKNGTHPWVMGSDYADGVFNFTLYPNGGHNAWTKTYAKNVVWDWLFSQTKSK